MKRFCTLLATALVVCFTFTAVAGAATVQEIKDRGVLKAAVVDFELEPFVLTKDSELTGLDIELANAIAAKIGVKLELVRVPWDGGITKAWDPAFTWDTFDMAISAITIKDSRAEVCDFSEWYVTTGQMALVRVDSGIKTKDDLKGKKLAARNGTTGEAAAKEVPEAQLVSIASSAEGIKAVKDKTVDASVDDGIPLLFETRKDSELVVLEDDPLSKEKYGIATQKGSDMKALLDEIVKTTRMDLYKKWIKGQ